MASSAPEGDRWRAVLAAALTLGLLALPATAYAKPTAGKQRLEGLRPVAKPVPGFDLANLDRSVSPSVDFYQFANGGWLAKHPIPAEMPRFGRFNLLAEKNLLVLRSILARAAAHLEAAGPVPDGQVGSAARAGAQGGRVRRATTRGKHHAASRPGHSTLRSEEALLGAFYKAGMDTAAIEKAGLRPLRTWLAKIDAVRDTRSLLDCITAMQRNGISALFSFAADQDPDDSSHTIGDLSQGGLGLPDRDYYLKDDERSKAVRDAYQVHIERMLGLLGEPPEQARAEAAVVLDLETRLAKASMSRVACRDPKNIVHKKSCEELIRLTPHFNWARYLAQLKVPEAVVNVEQPDFFAALDTLLEAEPIDHLRTYLRWHLVDSLARYLPERFVRADFDFHGTVLTGAQAIPPRWKRVVRTTDELLGDALGKAFVKRTFSPAAKRRVLDMVADLQAVLRDDLQTLPWMSAATRSEALQKLDAFTRKIGYPDRWRSYRGLRIERRGYLGNVLRARAFKVAANLRKIGHLTDRSEWHMTPPTVNAYYNPSVNEIVFPAGILQPPFFDGRADDAINYGGIGAVIGHEMTHGFDDQGAKFDARGNLRNWWAPADLAEFEARSAAVVRQFDAYEAEPGLHLNGKLVVGESIADLGGLTLAYRALQRALARHPVAARLDGFTPEQRFFLGWAQIWAVNMRPEYVRLQVQTDPHPLARYRVNGPLSNMPEFAKAFEVPADAPMVRPPEQRCTVW
jgi:putative endopeptidase